MRHGLASDRKDDDFDPKLCKKLSPLGDNFFRAFVFRKHLYTSKGVCRRCGKKK